jgi:hypothetical protein
MLMRTPVFSRSFLRFRDVHHCNSLAFLAQAISFALYRFSAGIADPHRYPFGTIDPGIVRPSVSAIVDIIHSAHILQTALVAVGVFISVRKRPSTFDAFMIRDASFCP